jgi:hypothetical protein
MTTLDLIYEKAKELPVDRQIEALHYVSFLLSQEQANAESAEWAAHSSSQMAKQYAPENAIYDQD